ncbi:glycosyltransferase family 4 protein [Microvirga sp. 2TAF3]|uniref:glycosyltransferase family 4 protein n=1 Tax=Microvirga sp. 2TAF3 TaxID=3233014 RepID=UPI003F953E6D
MKVILCGPIAQPGTPALGGFQSANLRLAELFKRLSYKVEPLPYPIPQGHRIAKAAAYATGFLRMAYKLSSPSREAEVLHITPLIRHFLPFELLLVRIAKWRKRLIVVDMRAGDQIINYRRRGSFYRMLYRALVTSADAVTFEGKSYDPFIAELAPSAPRQLISNFVPSTLLNQRSPAHRGHAPVMVYVGKLCPSKGVFRAAKLFQEIKRQAPEAQIKFVGAGPQDVKAALVAQLAGYDGVTFAGSLSMEEIIPVLDTANFFIFLSTFPGEGHSNALTEAMARGCVPVCTQHGFNVDVVGSAGIVLGHEEQESALAARVLSCWQSQAWEQMSRDAALRAEKYFSDTAVSTALESIYRKLLRRDAVL